MSRKEVPRAGLLKAALAEIEPDGGFLKLHGEHAVEAFPSFTDLVVGRTWGAHAHRPRPSPVRRQHHAPPGGAQSRCGRRAAVGL